MRLNVKMRYFRSEFFKILSDSESATPKTVESEKISKKTASKNLSWLSSNHRKYGVSNLLCRLVNLS